MVEKANNRDKICEKLEKWLDPVTKIHDEVIQKARNYIGTQGQASSVSSRSGEVASSKIFEKTSMDTSI